MKKAIKLLISALFIPLYFSITDLPAGEELPLIDPDQKISMDFQDASLKDVLKIFSIQSGLSFIASDNIQDKRITLYMDKVAIKDAMNKLFMANNLVYQLDNDSNIFIVKNSGKPEVDKITRVYYLKYYSVTSSALVIESASPSCEQNPPTSIMVTIKSVLSQYGSISEDKRTNSLIVTDMPSVFPEVEKIIAALDISQPQIMLEVEMLDVSKGTTDKMGIDWTSAGSYSMNIASASQSTTFPYGQIIATRLADVTNTLTMGNVTFPTNLKLILNFLNTQSDTKFLARPKILTMNNEVSEIKITTDEVVGEKRTVEGTGSSATSTYEAERYETGVSLRVTPQINPDTNEITMVVIPSVTEASKSSIVGSSGAAYYNPEVRTSKSMIRVKDGETIVVGGLIKNKSAATVVKIPVLGSIPLLGLLFRNKEAGPNQERELLVFITPRIVKDKKVNLAQAKKIDMFEREQGAFSLSDRDLDIDGALDDLDRKKE